MGLSPGKIHQRREFCGDRSAKTAIHVANRCFDELRCASAQRHSRHARRYAASLREDALIAVFDAKYHYEFWCPVTAIRNGDIDNNPATERAPAWGRSTLRRCIRNTRVLTASPAPASLA